MPYKRSLALGDTFSITCKKLKFDFFTGSRRDVPQVLIVRRPRFGACSLYIQARNTRSSGANLSFAIFRRDSRDRLVPSRPRSSRTLRFPLRELSSRPIHFPLDPTPLPRYYITT